MHIFHLPSCFPSRHSQVSGISAKDFIHSFSKIDLQTRHSVSLFLDTSFYFTLRGGKFLSEFFKYLFHKSAIEEVQINKNLNYYYAKKNYVYSSKLGYKEKANWLKAGKENLEYTIKEYGKPDIIHAQFTRYGGWVAWKLSREFSIPYVITERFGPFPGQSFLKPGKNILTDDIYFPMKEADALISVSEAHASDIRKYVDKEVHVIPNLIDVNLFSLAPDKVSTDEFVFVTLTSSYQPNKGIEGLLKAIKLFKEKGGTAKFKIGGGVQNNYFKKLKHLSSELQVDKDILWFEKQNRQEVVTLLQKCNCLISPSIYESFSLVCAEAIACGKPVVATRSGGPEGIIKEMNGLLVDVEDSEMMADAMLKINQNIKQYDPYRIREDCINRFSPASIVSQYYQLYRKLINQQ